MRFPAKQFKRFIPGILIAMAIITTTAVLLFLSVDNNEAPDAMIESSSLDVEVGETVFLDGRASTDPDGDDITYHWTINETVFNEQPHFHYAFTAPGTFKVTLEVEDSSGNTDTEMIEIVVRAV